MRVVFHAPLKDPDHPQPSGDRTVGRLLLAALDQIGIAVDRPCRLRMYDRDGDAALIERLAAEARAAAQAHAAAVRTGAAPRPDAVLTYHCYHKAPDVFGPALADALGLPYAIVEGSLAPRRAEGPWAAGHALSLAALRRADALLVMNARDRPALAATVPGRLVDLPPFLDAAAWPILPRQPSPDGIVRLLTVAMMRPGDKFASYTLLAEALAGLGDLPWRLTVAGDGEAEPAVRAAFARWGERVAFAGRLEPAELGPLYAASDLLVWPAVNEAFGMVFLEAAAHGCPALAMAHGGVPGVVRDGRTGRLTPAGDVGAFRQALTALIHDAPGRERLGEAAARFAREERSLAGAARILHATLATLVGRGRAA